MYESLDKREVKDVEKSILDTWKKEDILNETIKNREGKKDFVFYDGPIYANAKPGIHHVFAKTIKDSFCKYKVMNGYRVLRKIGLDTHGLPIEVNVEKKLGFSGKADIEKFGVDAFCRECNKATATNINEVNHITDMMGQFIDCKNPYITCSNDYIESEWWIIKQMDEKGLLYHGNKVLWYCPRCGTELSQNEVSQGYTKTSVNTVIVPLKRVDADEYFLAWTTTPWTLMANVAICVNPDMTYIKSKSKGYQFIVAESLADRVLGEDYEVVDTFKGSDLVGIKYEQLMPFVHVEGKCHEVIADHYVTDSDGTGIVHIAPAFGADDNRVCSQNGIGFVNPVGLDGRYTTGPWEGRLVTDPELEIDIIKWLKANDKLFKKIKIEHDYPHCWRCKSPLISYPKPAWYIKTTEYKDKIIEANKKIHWYPAYVGEKRFGNWLENMVDWGISRNRYWGCPLPVWECSCGKRKVIGSLDELQENVVEDVNVREMELHRPYVDQIHLKCSCGKEMTRVKDVLDVWFDSGSMPYAQFHYPFENQELFKSQFPADFIAEGLDQTRGWFYVLLVISTIISGESSFKNVVVNDMMLDEFGKKMSKSVGNIVDPIEMMEKYGADNIRWYMLYTSPVWTPLKFSEAGVREVHSKFFNPFKNTYTFFQTYANIDHINIEDCKVKYEEREEIDKWLLSKYNHLIEKVREFYEMYDLNLVVREITNFVSEDLSNWYIRRNRNRFWGSDMNISKKSVYMTTYEVMEGLCRLCAPVIPYLTEEIYTKLTKKKSVHLADFPVCSRELIDSKLEYRMDLVRDLITMGRNIREESKIKVRQPIKSVMLESSLKNDISGLESLIKEELNVKEVLYVDDVNLYMNISYKPNFRVAGKVFGKDMKEFSQYLENINKDDLLKLSKGELEVNFNGNEYKITEDLVDKRIESKEGFNVCVNDNLIIILDLELTDDLINEGLARETISKIQNLRKSSGFDIADRINIYYSSNDLYRSKINDYIQFICDETLALSMNKVDSIEEFEKINDFEVGIKLEKIEEEKK